MLFLYCRPKSDPFGVYRFEIDFFRAMSSMANKIGSKYFVADFAIGNPFSMDKTNARIDSLESESYGGVERCYAGFYKRNVTDIRMALSPHLRTEDQGVCCLIVNARGALNTEEANYVHARVLVIEGKARNRKCILFYHQFS